MDIISIAEKYARGWQHRNHMADMSNTNRRHVLSRRLEEARTELEAIQTRVTDQQREIHALRRFLTPSGTSKAEEWLASEEGKSWQPEDND